MKTNITDNITIREVRISDSQKIYNAIHLHREYLQEWLPFVTFLTAEEEKAFLSSVLRVPRARRDFIYIIEEKQEVCGLIGFIIPMQQTCVQKLVTGFCPNTSTGES